MLSNEMAVLTVTAASLGFFHTLLGPDHYLPFVVMARARRWSQARTAWITFLCGVGHIGSSVALGLAGIALGIAVTSLEGIETLRGDLAPGLSLPSGLFTSPGASGRPGETARTSMSTSTKRGCRIPTGISTGRSTPTSMAITRESPHGSYSPFLSWGPASP